MFSVASSLVLIPWFLKALNTQLIITIADSAAVLLRSSHVINTLRSLMHLSRAVISPGSVMYLLCIKFLRSLHSGGVLYNVPS